MPAAILATRLYVPPLPPKAVRRTRLVERLDDALQCRLALVSAPAGFGKTTLVSEWLAGCGRPAAWLSLEPGDNDPARFLTYLIAALQTLATDGKPGEALLAALQVPQPPPSEAILTALLNDIAAWPAHFVLVLDDYHLIEAMPVEQALGFLVEHLPPQMHLVIVTREDPPLPLARYRARGQLAELRAADLRFTPAEAAEFLNQAMGLALTPDDIDALETRTEGWIAGLQLAAISMRGRPDPAGFIRSFTGSNSYVLDYLMEEVLRQQPEDVQAFLLRTSILPRLCGSLCDAVLGAPPTSAASAGQAALENLERQNLFILPLDHERRWYRYHHLFADLLRQRLQQTGGSGGTAELHRRASQWFEDHDLALEAFQQAAAANDLERAVHLIEEKRLYTHYAGVAAMLAWLERLPPAALDARPVLWVRYAGAMLLSGQSAGVEEKLQAAEAAIAAWLQGAAPDASGRDLLGQIASARATLALSRYQADAMLVQSRLALESLLPGNLFARFTATWTLGMAHLFRGERAAASRVFGEALALAEASGNTIFTILAETSLGQTLELENQLYPAAEAYRDVLRLVGEFAPPSASEATLGLARICYEWNDLEAAGQYGQQSLRLARLYDRAIDRFIFSEIFLARLQLAHGDLDGAAAQLAQTEATLLRQGFLQRAPDVAAAQVLALLRQGELAKAAHLAQAHPLPLSQARVYLARGDPAAALALLAPYRREMETRGWADETLRAAVLQALALQAQGLPERALAALAEALRLAEPGGLVRTFVDEGPAMARLLRSAAAQRLAPGYTARLLAVCEAEAPPDAGGPGQPERYPAAGALVEPLTRREIEILGLIAEGLSNQEISERLFLALSTVKGQNRVLFDKLQVKSRTDAVRRARELGLV